MGIEGGAIVVKLRVDFNNMIGSGLVLASAQGGTFSAGCAIAVYDEDTEVFAAEVIKQEGDTLVIRVSDKVMAEA